jgi:copper chaperone CopZ
MKKIFIIMLITACNIYKAQEKTPGVVTTTLAVRGNCGECKERIENAVDIKGVKVSQWDEKSQLLTVTYKPEKVTLDQIKEAILKSGHDLEDRKAQDLTYHKLPKCCQFRDQKCAK